MKMSDIIIQELSKQVSPRIGHNIGLDHIHTDEVGWHSYIPAKSLQANHPLILNHYRGPLFMVIPFEDWKVLEKGTVSVQEYVESSIWSFGYYWGGGSILTGIYWQPLEEKEGIHNTEKISRYLSILSCRTNYVSSGYMPTEEQCKSCKIEKCPFSRFAPKTYGASWENEVRELDERKLFFKAVKERIEKQFEGLKVEGFGIRDGCAISLFPYGIKNTVSVNLNQELLIDMLYHPGKHNIEEIANSLPVEICIPGYYKGKEYVKQRYVVVPENADIQFCYDQWAREWFEEEKTENCDSVREKMNFFEKIKNFFKNLF